MIEQSKSYFLVFSLLCSIFTNVQKISNINYKINDENSSLLKKLNYLTDISNFGYDIMCGNIISITIHFWCYFKRIRGILKYIKDKFKNNFSKT